MCAVSYDIRHTDLDTHQTSTGQTCGRTDQHGKKYAQHLLRLLFFSFLCRAASPHSRTLEVRPGRITKKLELKYDYDCERGDTKSLLGALMLGCDIVIANNE